MASATGEGRRPAAGAPMITAGADKGGEARADEGSDATAAAGDAAGCGIPAGFG